MDIPKTFAGLLGFVIVSGYIITLVYDDSISQTQQLSSQFMNLTNGNFNSTQEETGISGFFSQLKSIFNISWATIQLSITAISSFINIPQTRGLPPEFIIYFSVLIISGVVMLVKVIWSGE